MPYINKKEAKELKYANPMLQTILIDREAGLSESKQWLAEHNYRHEDYRLTKNERRFMQASPVLNGNFFSKKLSTSIGEVILVYERW